MVRSLALTTEFIDYKEKVKESVSLQEIQNKYFSIIEKNFSNYYQLMLDKKMTPHLVASYIAYKEKDIDSLDSWINDFLAVLEEFWKSTVDSWYMHLEDEIDSIKAVFWGDLFPSNEENIASKCGIYTDTIVLPCPYMRTKDIFLNETKEKRVYYLIKHWLNILKYKELAITDLDKPIVVILADNEMLDVEERERMVKLWENDTLYHAKKVFWRDFHSIEELLHFAKELETVDKVMWEIKNPDKVLFDIDIRDQLEQQIKIQTKEQSKLIGIENSWLLVAWMWIGRMTVCNELLSKASRFGWTPLIDAPTSWEYFKWKLEYDAERIYWEHDYEKMHIMKALSGVNNTDIEWVWNIPTEWLIELRKTWAILELRDILWSWISDLVSADSNNFSGTSKKVSQNLDEAIIKHQENIKKLRNKKWKIAGHDFSSLIVVGSAEIVAICSWAPLVGLWAAAAGQFVDWLKVKDIPKTFSKMRDVDSEKRELKKSASWIMFKYKK